MYLALYATKAFLPIYALSAGHNVAVAGTFFAVQEAVHTVLNPVGGRLGDRLGYRVVVPLGMVLLGATLPLLTVQSGVLFLFTLAGLIGVSQALVFPSTVALVSDQVQPGSLATGMGLIGTLKNGGKVAGPALAGLLIHWSGYTFTFQLMGVGLVLGAVAVWQGTRLSPKSSRARRTVPV
jgi:MFS family permease